MALGWVFGLGLVLVGLLRSGIWSLVKHRGCLLGEASQQYRERAKERRLLLWESRLPLYISWKAKELNVFLENSLYIVWDFRISLL